MQATFASLAPAPDALALRGHHDPRNTKTPSGVVPAVAFEPRNLYSEPTMTRPAPHWLDRVFEVLLSRPHIYADGWGTQDILHRVNEETEPFSERVEIHPDWEAARVKDGVEMRAGTFTSPALAEALPDEAKIGHVLSVRPAGAQDDLPTWVALAASGEQGFGRRLGLLAPLVREGRCAAIVLENPYYGARRPRRQRGAKVRTVADQFVMNIATIQEGLGLLAGLRARGTTHVGITGYSMGGHMAAYVASHDGGPLAVVPAATGLSAEPIYTQGALQRSIAWHRLGEPDEAKARLGALLRKVIETLPPLSADNPAILVAARNDGFVFPEQVEQLAARWPHAELRWVDGGHVTALVRRADVIRDAMRDAMARLTGSGT